MKNESNRAMKKCNCNTVGKPVITVISTKTLTDADITVEALNNSGKWYKIDVVIEHKHELEVVLEPPKTKT